MQPSELADAAHAASGNPPQRGLNGGRFDFDDGGTYCGGWEDGKAHGHGVCTGPKAQGAYAGSWHYGFEVSGVYTWPSGSSFEGQWQNGKRHGMGVETRDRWLYRGEWTQGYKGRYGVRQSTISNAKYEGTWANGLQDGYGSETYADGGTYKGQWMRGLRHGYGVRTSAPFGLASHYRGGARGHRGSLSSLNEAGASDPSDRRVSRMDDARGGFVLITRSDQPSGRRGSLVGKTKSGLLGKWRKQRSVGDLDGAGTGSVHSGGSGGSGASWVSSVDSTHSAMTHASLYTNSNTSFVIEDEHLDASVTETYLGEWKNDKRTGYGISERSDGLRYEGEWAANKKYGYGVTTFRDGTKEEGKYKNNVLITSQKRKHMFLMRSAKFRERVDSAVTAAQRASKIAIQKADIAVARTATARGKADQADEAADQAKEDCDIAQATAKQFAPDFKHPGFDKIGLREKYRQKYNDAHAAQPVLQESEMVLDGKSIPNHIPPTHSQIPQNNKTSHTVSSRRPSTTQYPKTVPYANYNADNRVPGPPHDPYYSTNQDNWSSANTSPQFSPDNQKPLPLNEHVNPYGSQQPASRFNRQDALQYQQNIDQTGIHSANQDRRLSSATRPQINQRTTQQDWNAPQPPQRKQSVLGQPTYDAQGNVIEGGNTGYRPNDVRTGTVRSEGPLDRPMTGSNQQSYHQASDPQQVYRQTHDQSYGHQVDQSHRQMTHENQVNRQHGHSDASYRPTASNEQEMVNGGRDPRAPGSRPSIDYFDHYKRPPSRDSSVDRYGRRSRQPSVEAVPSAGSRAGSVAPQPIVPNQSRPQSRAATPAGNGHLASGRGSISRAGSRDRSIQPFEDSLLRKRTLGQEISPSPYQPKRTESLYVAQVPAPPPPVPMGGGGGGRKMLSTPQTLQRKKSLPDVAGMPRMSDGTGMSREEVSALGSARREEVRRMHEETEKLRANPLLYLVSPQVKDWFSRQQLVILVLFINISLGIMFFKLLT